MIFPNVYNIIYTIPLTCLVNIMLFDECGRKVLDILENTEQTPGRYKIPLNVSNLSNGVYIFAVTAGEQTSSQKLTIVRN